jgi:hypothetical protein
MSRYEKTREEIKSLDGCRAGVLGIAHSPVRGQMSEARAQGVGHTVISAQPRGRQRRDINVELKLLLKVYGIGNGFPTWIPELFHPLK